MALKDINIIYKALSDETRLKLLKLLEGGELCVCDLVAAFDTVQPKISFHLSVLKEAGLIRDRKEGKWSFYSITNDDLFKRFLVYSTIEHIDDLEIEEERKRLNRFLEEKKIIKRELRRCKC